jgi:hypothetical protein
MNERQKERLKHAAVEYWVREVRQTAGLALWNKYKVGAIGIRVAPVDTSIPDDMLEDINDALYGDGLRLVRETSSTTHGWWARAP